MIGTLSTKGQLADRGSLDELKARRQTALKLQGQHRSALPDFFGERTAVLMGIQIAQRLLTKPLRTKFPVPRARGNHQILQNFTAVKEQFFFNRERRVPKKAHRRR